ncbi:MAG: PQQ-binding-like beta-propeller repeat protein [Candidatus Sumerlaeia bacterium]
MKTSSTYRNMLIIALMCVILTTAAFAMEAKGWLGDGDSKYHEATPPVNWSEDQNIVWKADTADWGNATPVIVGDKIFITEEKDTLVCLSKKDGSVLWKKSNPSEELLTQEQIDKKKRDQARRVPLEKMLGTLEGEELKLRGQHRKDRDNQELKDKMNTVREKMAELRKEIAKFDEFADPKTHSTNGYASPTPVSDGEYVYAHFATGIGACYDLEGNRQWMKMVEKPTHNWGQSSSPVLAGGKVIFTINKMFALDPKTGEQIWEAPIKHGWGTPMILPYGDTSIAVTCQGDVVQVSDGKVLESGLFSLKWGSAGRSGRIIYAADMGNAWAYEMPDKSADEFKAKKLWQTKIMKDRVYATPLEHDGILYVVTKAGVLMALDAKTGEEIYKEKLPFGRGTTYPSPILAGDKLYFSHDDGTTVVVKTGRQFEKITENKLPDFRATPVAEGDRLYIRGLKTMYCIGG